MRSLPRPRRAAVAVVVAFAALELGYVIWVAFVAHGRVGPRVGYGPDSVVYLTAARAPLWSREFFAGPGPFGFLLLAKLCARNLRAIVIVQTLLTTGAWILLATTVVSMLGSRVARWMALIAIFGVGLSPTVLQWNAFITTESLSISLLCVVIALGVRLVSRPSRRDVALFVAGMAAFAFTRDTNALGVGFIAVIALAAAVRPAWRASGVVIGVAGVVLALGASALANAAEPPRWYWPVGETVSIRLLADPGATRYLADHEFPLDEQTRTLPQRYIYVVREVVHGREYAPLRAWLRADGRRVYAEFLLTHPGWTLRRPFDDRQRFFVPGVDVYGVVYHVQPRGAFGVVGALTTPPGAPLIELWALAAAFALGWCWWQNRHRALVSVIGLALVLAILGFYASWHGDALEADRHALTSAVQLRLALWMATVVLLDVLSARGGPSTVCMPCEADFDRAQHQGAPGHEESRRETATNPT